MFFSVNLAKSGYLNASPPFQNVLELGRENNAVARLSLTLIYVWHYN